ncbi:MAG: plasmid mobilization relaxosome protein MobC, partial [Mesorhizobium sp.]
NTGRVPVEGEVAGSIKDAHIIATTVASELAAMTRRSAATRREEDS